MKVTLIFLPTVLLFGLCDAFHVYPKAISTFGFRMPNLASPRTKSSSLICASTKPPPPTVKDIAHTIGSPSPSRLVGNRGVGSVQGTVDPEKVAASSGFDYGFEIADSNPELYSKLQKLTRKRPYPLFLLEKAAALLPQWKKDSRKQDNCSAITKEKLVVLGAGWASAALLSDIDNHLYDVTVISPRNYFLFTPLLASSSVGTVDVRSIMRPIREVSG